MQDTKMWEFVEEEIPMSKQEIKDDESEIGFEKSCPRKNICNPLLQESIWNPPLLHLPHKPFQGIKFPLKKITYKNMNTILKYTMRFIYPEQIDSYKVTSYNNIEESKALTGLPSFVGIKLSGRFRL